MPVPMAVNTLSVGELIEQLQKCDPRKPVHIVGGDEETFGILPDKKYAVVESKDGPVSVLTHVVIARPNGYERLTREFREERQRLEKVRGE